jgi:hypothetical protein
VLVTFGCIREASIGCAGGHVLVESARSEGDSWALHFLDGADTAKNPKVGVGDPRELRCRQMLVSAS